MKKVFLKISQSSQENTYVGVSSLKKAADIRPAILLKKWVRHRCFPVNFVKFSRTPSYRTPPPTAASNSVQIIILQNDTSIDKIFVDFIHVFILSPQVNLI